MTRRSRIAALVALVALAAAGCANNDAKESDVVGAMEDAGLTTEQSECIGERMQDEFGDDQDLYNEVAGATDIDDLPGPDDESVEASEYPEGTEPVIQAILEECISGSGSDDASDTTQTTVAGDAATTTTAG